MKTNLKTFPRMDPPCENMFGDRHAMILWYLDFKKEIGKKIMELEHADRTAYGKALLLEILGELPDSSVQSHEVEEK